MVGNVKKKGEPGKSDPERGERISKEWLLECVETRETPNHEAVLR